jgi:hypothetical protein
MLIELLAAILVLAVGVLATFGVYAASSHANRTSELHEAEIHLAQGELERIGGMTYSQVGLKTAPGTSTDPNNPGFYVSGSGCANFQWNQSAGGTGTDALVVNGCSYVSTGVSFSGCSPTSMYCNGTLDPSTTIPANPSTGSPAYTIYRYVTWNQDQVCLTKSNNTNICPLSYDTKRVTVEVTNVVPAGAQPGSPSATFRPAKPVLVSGIVTDPHAVPLVGNPNVNNPLNIPGTPCTDANGNPIVPCNLGLGGQTPNTWWLTNTIQQTANTVYSAPTGNNSCMHYTDQLLPLNLLGQLVCGGTQDLLGNCAQALLTPCPRPDLLWNAPPSTSQEYNFSPNLSSNTAGRVILRDSSATGSTPAAACGATASKTAQTTELWATGPLGTSLNLTGNGGMTLYTSALHGLAASVVLCVGVYLESPVLGILDPLNLLGSNDQVRLGVAAYANASWPAVPTPLQFTFSNLFSAQAAAAGSSLAVRIWVTASGTCGGCSGDDLVVQYDAGSAQSSLQLDSQ